VLKAAKAKNEACDSSSNLKFALAFLAHFMIMLKPGVNELLSLNKKRDLVTK